jgi:hypothetical protein
MKTLCLLISAAVLLVGCMTDEQRAEYDRQQAQPRSMLKIDTKPYVPPPAQKAAPQAPDRFTVTRVQVVRDTSAYGNERGVYIIKDAETGAEFVGLSGVGIVELARINCGKACTKEIER